MRWADHVVSVGVEDLLGTETRGASRGAWIEEVLVNFLDGGLRGHDCGGKAGVC